MEADVTDVSSLDVWQDGGPLKESGKLERRWGSRHFIYTEFEAMVKYTTDRLQSVIGIKYLD